VIQITTVLPIWLAVTSNAKIHVWDYVASTQHVKSATTEQIVSALVITLVMHTQNVFQNVLAMLIALQIVLVSD
jgi:hypothetical protein